MRLAHLSLTHFRNYRRLELDFAGPLTLLQGQNAQGKTNLLEAIFFLATSRSVHAQAEREIVDWQADAEPIPYCRVAGAAHIAGRQLEIEIILTPRADGANFAKQIKINGVARRAMDLVGQLRAVLFLPEDIRLIDGGPGERRRYLDIALCQIDPAYCRALSSFQQVVTQRNSLLKALREQEVNPASAAVDAQLAFWDERMVQHGAAVIARRHNFVLELERQAVVRHTELSGGRETLSLLYLPSFNPGQLPDAEYELVRDGLQPASASQPVSSAVVAEAYTRKLVARRAREIVAGNTLYGPHRDDLRLLTNGRDLRLFGSRGQQRSAALALKLAELQAMTLATGEAPVLLLDDVMSELDEQRRSLLLGALAGVEQTIVTTTDLDDFTPAFRAQAQLYSVAAGSVSSLNQLTVPPTDTTEPRA